MGGKKQLILWSGSLFFFFLPVTPKDPFKDHQGALTPLSGPVLAQGPSLVLVANSLRSCRLRRACMSWPTSHLHRYSSRWSFRNQLTFSLQVGSSLTEQNGSFVAPHNVSIDDGGLERAGRPVFINVRWKHTCGNSVGQRRRWQWARPCFHQQRAFMDCDLRFLWLLYMSFLCKPQNQCLIISISWYYFKRRWS